MSKTSLAMQSFRESKILSGSDDVVDAAVVSFAGLDFFGGGSIDSSMKMTCPSSFSVNLKSNELPKREPRKRKLLAHTQIYK